VRHGQAGRQHSKKESFKSLDFYDLVASEGDDMAFDVDEEMLACEENSEADQQNLIDD
jgi:hypothetical protein